MCRGCRNGVQSEFLENLAIQPENSVHVRTYIEHHIAAGREWCELLGHDPEDRQVAFNHLTAYGDLVARGINAPELMNDPDIREMISPDDEKFMTSSQVMARRLMRGAIMRVADGIPTDGMSRMKRSFRTHLPLLDTRHLRVVNLAIARAGLEVTYLGREALRGLGVGPISTIHATCQRSEKGDAGVEALKAGEEIRPYYYDMPAWRTRPVVPCTVKGKTGLKDKKGRAKTVLTLAETADASGETVVSAYNESIKLCESKPDQLVCIFLNAHRHGIKRIQEAIPDVPIHFEVGVLHKALTIMWYLDLIGISDGGAYMTLTIG